MFFINILQLHVSTLDFFKMYILLFRRPIGRHILLKNEYLYIEAKETANIKRFISNLHKMNSAPGKV